MWQNERALSQLLKGDKQIEPFKNLINKTVATKIAIALKKQWPKLDQNSFLKNLEKDLAPLELKERVTLITERIRSHLPEDAGITIPLLVGALKKNEADSIGLDHFSVWPLTHYVATYGLSHFDLSLNALKEMTKVFTSEFAVRPFFVKDEKRALKFMKSCSKDENEHVRRWASEGSRPLLPWGMKLHGFIERPFSAWDILEKLKDDPSEYVRKSVANHLNDLSKNHPDKILDKLLEWHQKKNVSPELRWVIRHASRSLIKKGYQKAFLLHGVESAKIKVIEQKILSKKVMLGESLKVRVKLQNLSKKSAKIIIDHEMHLLKANNRHIIKVFKGKKITLEAGEKINLEMAVPLRPVTTRVYHHGLHHWNVKINGVSSKALKFYLDVK